MSPRRARAVLDRVGQTPAAALHAHLVEVAERLLTHRSVASITTREVAREAGVSDGVLYNYFADKHELLLAALLRRFDGLAERFAADLPEPGSETVATNLEKLCRAQVAFQGEILPMLAGLLAEPALLTRLIAETHRDAIGPPFGRRWIVDYLDGEQKLGRISPDVDRAAVAQLVMGSGLLLAFAQHLEPLLATAGAHPDREDRIEELVATLMLGLDPRPPAG